MKQNVKQHLHENEWKYHTGMQKMLQHWEEKTKDAFLKLLESKRTYLEDLIKDTPINEEIIRNQLYQIDLEEERLRMP
ncbi:MAG: hypothetical protein ABI813_10670 [Bacteroidota bacterium]